MKRMLMKLYIRNGLLAFCLALFPVSALMAAQDIVKEVRSSIVAVKTYEDNRLLANTLGFVVDRQGHIVTYLGEMNRADKISVVTSSGTELAAGKITEDRKAGIALLKVRGGADLKPLTFSAAPSPAGRRVYSLDLAGGDEFAIKMAQGAVGQILTNVKPGEPGFIQHNALGTKTGYGGPLLNNCGEILGMSTTKPAFLVGVFENYDPGKQGSNYALGAEWIMSFLDTNGVTINRADATCLSEEEKAKQVITKVEQKAKTEIGEAKKKLSEVEKKAKAAQQKAKAAQKEKEQARKKLEAMKKNLEKMSQKSAQDQEKMKQEIAAAEQRLKEMNKRQAELDAMAKKQQEKAELARKQAEEREKKILMISIGVVVVLLVLVVFFILRKKKSVMQAEQQKSAAMEAMRQVQSELEEKKVQEEHLGSLPDVLLEGTTPEGETIAIKIAGMSTGGAEGAVIGRNPSMCDYVVNHPEISRKHFRLLNVSGQLMIEDLGSTNGTLLNGEAMVPNKLEAVMNNSVLSMGDLQLTIRTVS